MRIESPRWALSGPPVTPVENGDRFPGVGSGRYRAPAAAGAERVRLTHSVPHLTGSRREFCRERENKTDGRGCRLSSSFIWFQITRRRRLRRASHFRQVRATLWRKHFRRLTFPVRQ